VDSCLLGGRSAAIDPRVARDEIGIVAALFLVLGDQPAGPSRRRPAVVVSAMSRRRGRLSTAETWVVGGRQEQQSGGQGRATWPGLSGEKGPVAVES
jgi:hypothetical protein